MLDKKLLDRANLGDAEACYQIGDCYFDGEVVERDYSKALRYYDIAAQKGNADAIYSIGFCYFAGSGVEKDVTKVVEYYTRAADMGHAVACRRLGFLYFWDEDVPCDYAKSFFYMKKGADAGDASAQAHIGQCYESGIWGAPDRDLELMRVYYDKALAQNSEHAQFCVGMNYQNGYNGYPKDEKRAFEYFLQSAENGSPKGQLELAICYVNGIGTEADAQKAFYWFEQSAEQGNITAKGRVGIGLISGVVPYTYENLKRGYQLLCEANEAGDSVAHNTLEDIHEEMRSSKTSLEGWFWMVLGGSAEKDGNYQLALECYKKSVDFGAIRPMNFVGCYYMYGRPGVPQNESLGIEWIKRGAELGGSSAQFNLGICYIQGRGVPENQYEAKRWLEEAVKQDEVGAMICLADIFSEVPATYIRAEQLYQQAISHPSASVDDVINAKCSLGFLYGSQELYSLALPLWREAAESDNPNAQYAVGCCYYNGEGVPKDVNQAICWWKRAAANGSIEAKNDLDSLNLRVSGTGNNQIQSQNTSSGCYVATAVYGSYDCPEVWTLRRFRDYCLAETWYGKAFISLYYAISPTIVRWFGNQKWFNSFWKSKLDRMVRYLQEKGYESSEYEDD